MREDVALRCQCGDHFDLLAWLSAATSDICAAVRRDALQQIFAEALAAVGFASFNLAVLKRDKRQVVTEPTLTSWSQADISDYDQNHWHLRDPLLHYAEHGDEPLIWTASSWDDSPQHADYGQFIKSIGLRGGVIVPLLRERDGISALTALATTDDAIPQCKAHALKVLGEVTAERTCSLHITQAPPHLERNVLTLLSEQQLTILEWARQGKSNADIAVITNRSKRSVDYHMSEILRRLNVSSRGQAISIFSSR